MALRLSTGIFFAVSAASGFAVGDYKAEVAARPLVTVTMVATDGRLQPARGLRASDLRIEDSGQPVETAFCYPLAEGGVFANPLGAHEFSNYAAGAPPVVVLDLLNASAAERGNAAYDVVNLLRKRVTGGRFFVYLMTKDAKLYPVYALSANGAAADAPGAAQLAGMLTESLRAVNRLRPWELQVNEAARTQATLGAMRDLKEELARTPGRKHVLWISHGAPMRPTGTDRVTRDYIEQFRSLASDLAQEDVAVYAVDQEIRRLASTTINGDGLDEVAAATGGLVFGSDRLPEALARMEADSRSLYRVGYYLPAESVAPGYRTVRITAVGKDVGVRTIAGYEADPAMGSAAARLAKAALGASDQDGLRVRVSVTPSAAVPGWGQFSARVDLAGLSLESAVEGVTGRVSLLFAEYDSEWQTFGAETAEPIAIRAADYSRALSEGVVFAVDRGFNPATKKIRVVVQDAVTGAVGSVTIPVTAWGW